MIEWSRIVGSSQNRSQKWILGNFIHDTPLLWKSIHWQSDLRENWRTLDRVPIHALHTFWNCECMDRQLNWKWHVTCRCVVCNGPSCWYWTICKLTLPKDKWRLLASEIWVIIGSGNGLSPLRTCLAPKHCLNQRWLIVNESFGTNLMRFVS